MSLASPSTQSVQDFLFGRGNDPCTDENAHLEVDEKGQSMYIELLDGT